MVNFIIYTLKKTPYLQCPDRWHGVVQHPPSSPSHPPTSPSRKPAQTYSQDHWCLKEENSNLSYC